MFQLGGMGQWEGSGLGRGETTVGGQSCSEAKQSLGSVTTTPMAAATGRTGRENCNPRGDSRCHLSCWPQVGAGGEFHQATKLP